MARTKITDIGDVNEEARRRAKRTQRCKPSVVLSGWLSEPNRRVGVGSSQRGRHFDGRIAILFRKAKSSPDRQNDVRRQQQPNRRAGKERAPLWLNHLSSRVIKSGCVFVCLCVWVFPMCAGNFARVVCDECGRVWKLCERFVWR